MNRKLRRFRISRGSALGALALDVVDESTRTWVTRHATMVSFVAATLDREVEGKKFAPDSRPGEAVRPIHIVTPRTMQSRLLALLGKAFPEERFEVELDLRDDTLAGG